jgi:3alpha(or 20beta)-hydroxysteroid dehydrogenase
VGRLENRVIFIAGGASGIGRAEVELFAAEGARVMIADLNDELGEELAESLGEAAGFVHLDVAEEQSWERAVAACEEQFGALHGMVNNAGIYDEADLAATTPELYDRIVGVNERGAYLGLRVVMPVLEAGGGGSVVLISSLGGLIGLNYMFAYGVSKWGMRGIARYAAAEGAGKGIRVNSILPGTIATPLQATNTPETIERLEGMIPMGRIGEASEVASAALFLISEESSYVTGVDLVVDGGISIGP